MNIRRNVATKFLFLEGVGIYFIHEGIHYNYNAKTAGPMVLFIVGAFFAFAGIYEVREASKRRGKALLGDTPVGKRLLEDLDRRLSQGLLSDNFWLVVAALFFSSFLFRLLFPSIALFEGLAAIVFFSAITLFFTDRMFYARWMWYIRKYYESWHMRQGQVPGENPPSKWKLYWETLWDTVRDELLENWRITGLLQRIGAILSIPLVPLSVFLLVWWLVSKDLLEVLGLACLSLALLIGAVPFSLWFREHSRHKWY